MSIDHSCLWDEGVFTRADWLYDMYMFSKEYAYIHLPLLFLTRLPIQQEHYIQALVKFPEIIQCQQYISTEIIDGSALRFPYHQLQMFREAAFQALVNNKNIQKSFYNKLVTIRKSFPEMFLPLERNFLEGKKIDIKTLKKVYDHISEAIACNLAAPYFEIAYLKMNKQYQNNEDYDLLVNKYLMAPVFSNIIYYSSEYEKLENVGNSDGNVTEKLAEFLANKAFLENAIGDGSEYESAEFLCQKLNLSPQLMPVLKPDDYKDPGFIYDPSGLSDNLNASDHGIERIFQIMRQLQINEEFRHYWGIRLTRLLRWLAPGNYALNNWYFEDYARFLEKQ